MRKYIYILLLLLSTFNTSYSQKVIKEHWDRAKKQLKAEWFVNSMGSPDGFYKSYYQRGGQNETGFYKDGKKNGLWTQYRENATKPWHQFRIYNGRDMDGYDHQYVTMEKFFFESGSDAGKLKSWTEWDVSEFAEDWGFNGQSGDGHLIVKNIRYWSSSNGYFLADDMDFLIETPVEKWFIKSYYDNPNHTLGFKRTYVKSDGEGYDYTNTWYDENGVVTKTNTGHMNKTRSNTVRVL